MDPSNEEFVRLLVNNLILLRRRGVDFTACFVDLDIAAYGGILLDYAISGNNRFLIAAADIVSCAGTNDRLDILSGYVKNRIYFNHSDGKHCSILSDELGTYRRWNISYTQSSTNRGIVPDVSLGANVSENPAARRIPPEILQSLVGNQMIYKDGISNDIFLMCIN